jgi:hypothetical protein
MSGYKYQQITVNNINNGDHVIYQQDDSPLRVGVYRDRYIKQEGGGEVHYMGAGITIVAVYRVTPKVQIPTRVGIFRAKNYRGQNFLVMHTAAGSWYALGESGPEVFTASSAYMSSLVEFEFKTELALAAYPGVQ